MPLRGLGAREIVIHGAAIAAALRGAPLRPYLAASVAGDVADIVATVAGRDGLPDGAAPATVAVAGGSALLTRGRSPPPSSVEPLAASSARGAGPARSCCCTRSAPTATCGRR